MSNFNPSESVYFSRIIPTVDSNILVLDESFESSKRLFYVSSEGGLYLVFNQGEEIRGVDTAGKEICMSGRSFNLFSVPKGSRYCLSLEKGKKYLLYGVRLQLFSFLNYLNSNLSFLDFLSANDKGDQASLFEFDQPIRDTMEVCLQGMSAYEQMDSIGNPAHESAMKTLSFDVFEEFKRLIAAGGKVYRTEYDINVLRDFISYICTNAEKGESIEEVADKLLVSTRSLSTIVKGIFGVTPGVLKTSLLFGIAKGLLIFEDWSIEKIANYIGYKHDNSFSSAFKEHIGYTPEDFRDINRVNRNLAVDANALKGCSSCPVITNKNLCFPFEVLYVMRDVIASVFGVCATCSLGKCS